MRKKLRVMLGDLRHETIGRHNVYIPLQIGYIGSYLLSQFESGCIDLRLYSEIDELDKDINDWKPDVIGLTNYIWNASVSKLMCKFAKQNIPNVMCVLGGPEFPTDNEERKHYLSERPEVDMYVYGDGEIAFANLVKKYLESGASNIDKLKSNANDGAISISHETGELVVGQPVKRFHDMDLIPSPYLNGLLDKWLVGDYMPTIETTRGCPFRCAFCFDSINKCVRHFSMDRVKDELSYIANKLSNKETKGLLVVDVNFGIYPRDLKTSDYLATLMEKYNWPAEIETGGTGKEKIEQVIECRNRAKKRFSIGISRQSMNPETNRIVNRRNYPMLQFLEIAEMLKREGQHPGTEVIIPMPAETRGSYFSGQKILMDAGISSGTWSTMMLKGTPLASKNSRYKYRMKTKYRILSRQFGEYRGEKCFEIEEICVSTNTMSFEEFIDCRSFSFLAELFTNEQLDIVYRHIDELDLSCYDYVSNVLLTLKSKNVCMSNIYESFVQEVRAELFDSPKEIYEYYSIIENYNDLLNGEKGDNLLRKYITKVFLIDWKELIEFLYQMLEETYNKTFCQKAPESLNSAKQWVVAMRDLPQVLNDNSNIDLVKTIEVPYDIQSWYENSSLIQEMGTISTINKSSEEDVHPHISKKNIDYFEGYTTDISLWFEEKKRTKKKKRHLTTYNNPVTYEISYNKNQVKHYLDELRTLWGGYSVEYLLGSMIGRGWRINKLWCICERIDT